MYQALDFLDLPTAPRARELFQGIAESPERPRSRAVDRPLVLYGAGSLGRMAREYLDKIGIRIELVVDANAERIRNDPYWSDLDLCSPAEVPPQIKKRALLAVCVVTVPYAPLAQQLHASGWKDVVPFYDIADAYRDRHPLGNGWFAPLFLDEERIKIGTALDAWADDLSRAYHLQFIAWRRLRQEWRFAAAPINTENRFFIPEVLAVLGEEESFLDAGAHLGHVTATFLAKVNGNFAGIWAVEPDRKNLDGLRATIAGLSREAQQKITTFPVAVGKTAARTPFCEGLGYASQCSPLGATTLDCTTIDDLGISPSFMKLHLEGMELSALQGAAKTVARHRPIIAATSYHNSDGLWRLPLWLAESLQDYSVYMRLHAWCGTGATVYAIPRERAAQTHGINVA